MVRKTIENTAVEPEKRLVRKAVKISGVVQGVGFRPFLYREAARLRLGGFARNTSYGVYAEIEGDEPSCAAFLDALDHGAPPLSRVTNVYAEDIPPRGETAFSILPSEGGTRSALISPDLALCADCLRELFDPADRRYRYPFLNCTNCGPRFTIVRDVPYDRANTSMASFVQCPDCQSEYENPLDRRFHAQPNACPDCGPKLSLFVGGKEWDGDPVEGFQALVRAEKIVAVKGLGGYHLACDAKSERAAALLRARKRRYEKPFAVMARDLDAAKRLCEVNTEEAALLTGTQKPIVLLKKRPDYDLAPSVAPGNARLGVMLPYTPLHELLLEEFEAIVLTSGNVSDRPMVFRDAEAEAVLSPLADAVLTHNRPIERRVDDSVLSVSLGAPRFIRRARGYAPEPLPLGGNGRNILAVGAQQKNTFCLARGEDAFVSSHIGDLDDPDTETAFTREIAAFERLFDCVPEVVACDLHPDYASTRYAKARGLPLVAIQHHRAHFASVLAETDEKTPALGFVWDGTGLGDDGAVWGGELLYGTVETSARIGRLLPFNLLGGEAAVREPWRCALAVLEAALGREAAFAAFSDRAREAALLFSARDAGVSSPPTTSMGRLFDALAALSGVRLMSSEDGQAAVELEQAADADERGAYAFDVRRDEAGLLFDWRPAVRAAAADVRCGARAGIVSARFHNGLVRLMLDAAREARAWTDCRTVALTGGCFLNERLLSDGAAVLEEDGFAVLINRLVPCGDGGISYGQAAAAAALQRK